MKGRLVGRFPTHRGAVVITVAGLFAGLLLASLVVRALDVRGAAALVLELAIVAGLTAVVWTALPDRYFTPWTGFHSGNEIAPWESPTDERLREERERAEAAGVRPGDADTRPAGDALDPRGDAERRGA